MSRHRVIPVVLALLLAVSLLSVAGPVSAASSGQKCKKAGLTATSKSGGKTVRLTCNKVGKRLLWKVMPTTTTTIAPTTTTAPGTTTTTTAPAVFLNVGVTYTAANGLTVVLNSFTRVESSASYRYAINYTLTNNVAGSKIPQGAWKLYTAGGVGLPQYGGFSDLFTGSTETRNYTFEELKTVPFVTLAYHENQFFSKTPPAGALLFRVSS